VAALVSARQCPVCGIAWGRHNPCESPACPCYGLRMGSEEAEQAAIRWRNRPSVAAGRTWSGEDALEHLERMTQLDYMAAVAGVEICHRSAS
jgi:hypothetical protein